jgi:hypothetical protein
MNVKIFIFLTLLVLFSKIYAEELACKSTNEPCGKYFLIEESKRYCARYRIWENLDGVNLIGLESAGIEISVKTPEQKCTNNLNFIFEHEANFLQINKLASIFELFMEGALSADAESKKSGIKCVKNSNKISLTQFNEQDYEDSRSRAIFFLDTECGKFYVSADLLKREPEIRIEKQIEFSRYEVN